MVNEKKEVIEGLEDDFRDYLKYDGSLFPAELYDILDSKFGLDENEEQYISNLEKTFEMLEDQNGDVARVVVGLLKEDETTHEELRCGCEDIVRRMGVDVNESTEDDIKYNVKKGSLISTSYSRDNYSVLSNVKHQLRLASNDLDEGVSGIIDLVVSDIISDEDIDSLNDGIERLEKIYNNIEDILKNPKVERNINSEDDKSTMTEAECSGEWDEDSLMRRVEETDKDLIEANKLLAEAEKYLTNYYNYDAEDYYCDFKGRIEEYNENNSIEFDPEKEDPYIEREIEVHTDIEGEPYVIDTYHEVHQRHEVHEDNLEDAIEFVKNRPLGECEEEEMIPDSFRIDEETLRDNYPDEIKDVNAFFNEDAE